MDNALEKLFEEIRAASTAIEVAETVMADANQAYDAARKELNRAKDRAKLLDQTLNKHIHEGMPILQAKMVAHQEVDLSARISDEATARTNAYCGLGVRVSTIEARYSPRKTV